MTTAIVDENKKEAFIAILDSDGRSHIMRVPMSDEELAEYVEYPDAYFGKVLPVQKKINDSFELFEWLMATQKTMPRDKILKWFSGSGRLAELEKLTDEELLLAYCEALVAAMDA